MIVCLNCDGKNNQHRSYCEGYKRKSYKRKNLSAQNEERLYWAALAIAMGRVSKESQDGNDLLLALQAEVQLRIGLRDRFKLDLDDVFETAKEVYERTIKDEQDKKRAIEQHAKDLEETIRKADRFLSKE